MIEYRMVRSVLMAEVSCGRVRGKPWLGWMDGVKVALSNRGMTVEAARQCAKDTKQWTALGPDYQKVFTTLYLIVYLVTRATML